MDPYGDIADYYDLEHDSFQDDVHFYSAVVTAGPVLELGVGSARILAWLADAGIEAWGVDQSEAMLRRARDRLHKTKGVKLVRASMIDFSLPRIFAFVLIPLNVLWHLDTPADQLRVLQRARRHLAPGGTVIVDTANPLTLADRGSSGEVRERGRWRTATGSVVALSSAWEDEAEQTLRVGLIYDETGPDASVHRSLAELTLRYIYRAELELMLQLAGFTQIQIYGSYQREPYAAASPHLLALAVSEGSPRGPD